MVFQGGLVCSEKVGLTLSLRVGRHGLLDTEHASIIDQGVDMVFEGGLSCSFKGGLIWSSKGI